MGLFKKKEPVAEAPFQQVATPLPEQQYQQQYTPMHETPQNNGAQGHGAIASPGPEIQQAQYGQPQQAHLPPYDQKSAVHGGQYPEHQGHYFPQQQAQGHHSGLNQAVPLHSLKGHAAPVDCPVCHTRALTATDHESGFVTHGLALVLCFCACLGCIPYFFSSLKNVHHRCGRCGASLATYHRDGGTEVHVQQM